MLNFCVNIECTIVKSIVFVSCAPFGGMWSNFFWLRASAAIQIYPELRLDNRWYYEVDMFQTVFNNTARNCLSLYRYPKTYYVDIGFDNSFQMFYDYAPANRITWMFVAITAAMLLIAAMWFILSVSLICSKLYTFYQLSRSRWLRLL